jgi:hypothetical protein
VVITNSGDGMVKLRVSVGADDNTPGVAAECNAISIKVNRDRAESNGSHKRGLMVALDVVKSSDLNGTVGGSLAKVHESSLRVGLFKIDASIVKGVLEAIVWPAAKAAER